MKLLAVELSSNQGSVALIENGVLVREVCWGEAPRLGQHVFMVTPRLLAEQGWAMSDLSTIAVGRGPGSYTGLRMAFSYAQGLALPGHTPIYAVQSAEALAAEVAESRDEQQIVVLGDARRGILWMRCFESSRALRGIRLVQSDMAPATEIAQRIPAHAVVVTPDWTRLATLSQTTAPSVRWIAENRYPRAAFVGRLASERIAAGLPSEPPLPIYTHPPVTAPPKPSPSA